LATKKKKLSKRNVHFGKKRGNRIMIFKQIRVNTAENLITNSYIVCDNKEAMVIDPGGEPEKIDEVLKTLEVRLKYIFLTHCHADHIGGVKFLKEKYNSQVLISKIDAEGLTNPMRHLGPDMGYEIKTVKADVELENKDIIHVGNLDFQVISTPGHTSGGMSLYCKSEKILFSGDTLFFENYGRTDLPTSSHDDIINSLKELIKLPEETKVYPGHGRPTTIGAEKENLKKK
jgi:glyoxylase-like metal-dependent hydrolase (beta-lactamase superfamily II)